MAWSFTWSLAEEDGDVIHKTEYGVTSLSYERKTRRTGEMKKYVNYRTYIPKAYLEFLNIKDKIYLYWDGAVYVTGTEPNHSVYYNEYAVCSTGSKYGKVFTLSKKFFPSVNEYKKIVYSLNTNKKDRFSNRNLLKMELK